MEKLKLVDKGGRRLGIDRRQLSVSRKGRGRRSNNERRSGEDRRGKWTYQEVDILNVSVMPLETLFFDG